MRYELRLGTKVLAVFSSQSLASDAARKVPAALVYAVLA